MSGFYGFFRLCKGKSFTYVHCFPSAELAQDARTEQLAANNSGALRIDIFHTVLLGVWQLPQELEAERTPPATG
jgi:hypothetical protein